MRVTTNFTPALAILLFGLLLLPLAAMADTYANCPTEPTTNVPIAQGETFSGSNCTLYTDGDVDSFTFHGTTGETYQITAGINGAAPTNICLTLYNPSFVSIFHACTSVGFPNYVYSVVADQKLTVTGTYTVVVTETSTANINYGVSLERLYPFPPDVTPVTRIPQTFAGNIKPLTDSDAFTFPTATTGKYRVTATVTSTNSNLCMTVYFSNFTTAGSGCTSIGFPNYVYIVQIDYTPTSAEAGTNMAFLQVAGNDNTATYSLEVSCLVGNCPQPPPPIYPPCTLTNGLTYNSTTSTLTMNFTVGNSLGTPANWSAWLAYADPQGTSLDTMQSLFSVSQPTQPNTTPPKTITKTFAPLPKEGVVGVLSTLSTPAKGIACSSWVQVNTGTEP